MTADNDPAMIAAAQQSPISGEGWQDIALKALQDIAEMTNPEGFDNYRADDREGCLDAVYSRADRALAAPPVPSVSGGEDQGSNRKGDLPTEQTADGSSSNEGAEA